MVQNNHLHSAIAQIGDDLCVPRTAINRDNEMYFVTRKAVGNSIPAQAVSFFEAMWQVINAIPTEFPKKTNEQRGRSDSIDVVIAENNKTLLLMRLEHSIHRAVHTWQQEWIAQAREARFKIVAAAVPGLAAAI